MRSNPSTQWVTLANWVLVASGLPLLLVLGYFSLSRQWVRWFGHPALATVIHAERVANLPSALTLVTLDITPDKQPAYVRIRRSARWSEHLVHPDQLAPGVQLRVRYRLARHSIVMPDARLH